MRMNIYTVTTETADMKPGQSYQSFNIAAANFDAAVVAAKKQIKDEWRGAGIGNERIQSLKMIASA